MQQEMQVSKPVMAGNAFRPLAERQHASHGRISIQHGVSVFLVCSITMMACV